MDARRRVAMAMRHQMPDRVPVMCQLALGHYFLHSERRPEEIWFDSPLFSSMLIEFQQRYRFDGILINLPGRPENWQEYVARREPWGQGERLIWKNGLVTQFPPDDNPQAWIAEGDPLPRAAIDRLDPGDPRTYRWPGYVWNTWHAPGLWDVAELADLTDAAAYPAWYTGALRHARREAPEISIHVEVFSPFTHLMELFGYQQALVALLDAPEVCHTLLDVFARMVVAQVCCYAPESPDAVLISSAFAGAGFISRAMYREFVLPYEQLVAAAVREYTIPVYTHTCGAIGDRLDLMAATGIDGIDTLDPPPLGTVDLAGAKEQFGRQLFFKGNLDAVNEMLHADDATFERAVRDRLRVGMPGAGYILSSACSVAPHVAPQRLQRLVELAEEYGRYET